MIKSLLSASLVLLAAGCATLTQGTRQEIAIATPGVQGAQCVVTDDRGEVLARLATPGRAQVERARSPLTVRCDRPGFRPVTVQVPSSFSSRSRVQSPIGYAVDGISGAMWSYPAEVTVTLIPDGA
ncbi:hypothetical protein [Phenylobacterium sp.]|jgi:hypothetical protein|uniref:hypothetical protein n=1 Tax=Phenylobacterium sp. TaxID=1871053 RepID=UPI003001D598